MRKLYIYPTYSCPYKCKFCYNLSKCDDKTLIDLDKLESFLDKHSNKFDKIIISGGEPSLLPESFMNDLIKTIKNHKDSCELLTYSILNTKVFNGVDYNISYDFRARPMVNECWENLLKFPKKFSLTITLSPLLYKYHPNKILHTLNYLPNIEKVTFRPFYMSDKCQYKIENRFLLEYMNMIRFTSLNLKYKVEFDEQCDEFVYNPYNKLNVIDFDNGIRKEIEIGVTDIEESHTNYPKEALFNE